MPHRDVTTRWFITKVNMIYVIGIDVTVNGYPYHFHHITTSTASNSLPFTRESISGKFCIALCLCNEFLYSSNSPNGICRKTWHHLSISSIGSTVRYCWSYLIKHVVSIVAYTLKQNNSLYFLLILSYSCVTVSRDDCPFIVNALSFVRKY